MAWRLIIYRQERGTRRETASSVDYATRDDANRAAEKLEHDVKTAEENDLIVVESKIDRISFVRQDFRSTKMFEA
jgi:hypothetical protein